MNALFEAAREVCDFLSARRWKYCVIGGLAVQRWGEPRNTQDVDFTLLTELGKEEPFALSLLEHFEARVPEALSFALQNRVLLLRAKNGIGVDVSFGVLNFEQSMMRRASLFEFGPGYTFPTCSAEDLFIMKAFAGRPHDWIDAQRIVIRQKGILNQRYILKHLTLLCELKEQPEIVEQARRTLRSVR